jgi:hypothetical protein
MRQTGTKPHLLFGGYEHRSYGCRSCGNESSFVFERAPKAAPEFGARELVLA